MKMRFLLVLVFLVAGAVVASAQQIPPPTGPVTFCGQQAPPTADSYTVSVDGATPVALTMAAPVAACPSGSTHSFTLPAALFTVGQHSVVVHAINQFGTTAGPSYAVVVGIAPGQFTVTAVIAPTGE